MHWTDVFYKRRKWLYVWVALPWYCFSITDTTSVKSAVLLIKACAQHFLQLSYLPALLCSPAQDFCTDVICSANVCMHITRSTCSLLDSPVQRFCRDRISRCKPCSNVSCSCRRNTMLLSTLSTCLASALLSITTCGCFTKIKKSKIDKEKHNIIFDLHEHAGWHHVMFSGSILSLDYCPFLFCKCVYRFTPSFLPIL